MNTVCPEKVVREIADNIDAGITCYLNPDTWEYEDIAPCVMEEFGPSDWDDEEEDDETDTGWQADLRRGLRQQLDKIDSWKHCIRIEQPESHESYRFMARFIEECIPENDIWCGRAWQAINGRRPFANFKHIVEHCSPYRQQWFHFKRQCLEKYVRDEIELYLPNE